MNTTTLHVCSTPKTVNRFKKGYSLVELLIVAGLIAILATVAIPFLYNAFTKTTSSSAADLTAEVVSAKNRSIVDAGGNGTWDSSYPDETSRFNALAPYLAISGVVPTNIAQLTAPLGATATLVINASSVAPTVSGLSTY